MTMNTPAKETDIVSDGERIALVRGPEPNEVWWIAHVIPGFGKNLINCDRIEPYYEACEQGATPWLRIVTNGQTTARVNAQHLDEIRYLPAQPPDEGEVSNGDYGEFDPEDGFPDDSNIP